MLSIAFGTGNDWGCSLRWLPCLFISARSSLSVGPLRYALFRLYSAPLDTMTGEVPTLWFRVARGTTTAKVLLASTSGLPRRSLALVVAGSNISPTDVSSFDPCKVM